MILTRWLKNWTLEEIAEKHGIRVETVVAYLRVRSGEWVK